MSVLQTRTLVLFDTHILKTPTQGVSVADQNPSPVSDSYAEDPNTGGVGRTGEGLDLVEGGVSGQL